MHDLGEEEAIGEEVGRGGNVVDERGEDRLAEVLGSEADVLARLLLGVEDGDGLLSLLGGLALHKGVGVEAKNEILGVDDGGRDVLLDLGLVGGGDGRVGGGFLELGFDGSSSGLLGALLVGVLLLDASARLGDALFEPHLELRVVVGFEKLGAEEDETVGVGGGSVDAVGLSLGRIGEDGAVDVLLEELDVDAVKAGCESEPESALLLERER